MTRAGLAAALLAAIAVAALPRAAAQTPVVIPDPSAYQDHRLVWDLSVEVRSGANAIALVRAAARPIPRASARTPRAAPGP